MKDKYFKYLPSFGSYRRKIKKQTELTDFILNNYIPENSFKLNLLPKINAKNINVIEIGCGNGDTAVQFAKTFPNCFYIACDVYLDGLVHTSKKMMLSNIKNINFWHADARLLIENIEGLLDYIFVFFPDPWPKQKHHKKRILNIDFLNLAFKALKTEGKLMIVTDDASYQEYIKSLTHANFQINIIDFPEWWIQTSYQSKAQKAERKCCFFEFAKK